MTDNRIKGTAMALGNFDGLHKGHMAVLGKALTEAEKRNLTPAVLLFDVHPKEVLTGKRPPKLMSNRDRNELLENLGFEIIYVSFDEYKDKTPEEFLSLICERYNIEVLTCGFNYRYGKKAMGSAETLKRDCEKRGVALFSLGEVDAYGEPVSSTRIRTEIEKGNIEKANYMLGREFSYKIEVVSGDKRGRLLGYPTINQFFEENFVTPRFGVYASKVFTDGKEYPAVTNIGVRPTINTKSLRSETCILGYSGNLYGKEVEVKLLSFIRDEKKFSDLEELSAAIKYDAERAREIYKQNKNV